MNDALTDLAATIADRRGADQASSYVAKLLHDGPALPARKLGEEAIETVVAALSGTTADLTSEAADLLFHLLVVLESRDVPLSDVLDELRRREGVSGIAEKAARTA